MEITDVRVRKLRDDGKMKAVVSVTFDDAFVVHDIKIIEGQNGLFVAMPSRKVGESDYRDIAHPIHQQMRNTLAEVVFAEYEKEKSSVDSKRINENVNNEATEEVDAQEIAK